MIIHVAKRASLAESLTGIIVATDDERILRTVREHGYEAMMTGSHHQSGSDRVWEVARGLDAEIIVNIQGDEPLLPPEALNACVRPFLDGEDVDVVTLCRAIGAEESRNPNVVKVVRKQSGEALYFSRASIPYSEHGGHYFAHVGIYAYKREALERFCGLGPSQLEQTERLEQLRGLEAGMRYKAVETRYESLDVNVPEDVGRAEAALRRLAGEEDG